MSPYEKLQSDIDLAFAAHNRDAVHLIELPGIVWNKMQMQLGIPHENITISKVENPGTGDLIPPQPDRSEISFDIIVTFPIKRYESLSIPVPLTVKYDRYRYIFKWQGRQLEVVNAPEVDQDALAKVVSEIGEFIKLKVADFLSN